MCVEQMLVGFLRVCVAESGRVREAAGGKSWLYLETRVGWRTLGHEHGRGKCLEGGGGFGGM